MESDSRNRDELIEEIVGMITGSLAWRSDDEIEAMLEAMKKGPQSGPSGLRAANNAVVVCINPTVGKEATVAALTELAERVDEQWDDLSGDTTIVVRTTTIPHELLN